MMSQPASPAAPAVMSAIPSPDETVRSGKFVAPPLPTERQAAWGLRLFGLFLLPFCAVGVGAAVAAVVRALAGDWTQAGFYLLFALVFGGVGFGLLGPIVLGRRTVAATIERAHAHPDEPWLWREDWAAMQVRDAARTATWRAIFFAVLWNLISIPVSIAVVGEELPKGHTLALLGLLFPLVGVVLAVSATRQTLRYRRFGVSQLDLERVPVPVGHPLVGTVRAAVDTAPPDGFRVVLSCIHRTRSGSGDDETTTEHVRWQEERQASGTAVRDYRGAGITIPIAFDIPADVQGTDESRPRDVIVWRLSVSASCPGVDYASTFDVPVYYTAESARPRSRDEVDRVARTAMSDPPAAPSSIVVTRDAAATTIFPAFRNPGPTLSLGAFTCLWTGTIWIQRMLGAPLFFPVITGVFAVVLWWVTLAMAFTSSRVVVQGDGLVVTRRFLGIPRRRSLAAPDVASIEMPIEMQAGSTPYYGIRVRRHAVPGRRLAGAITIGTGIRDKREAERLVAAIAAALGRSAPGS
jgi:hypothetical protein